MKDTVEISPKETAQATNVQPFQASRPIRNVYSGAGFLTNHSFDESIFTPEQLSEEQARLRESVTLFSQQEIAKERHKIARQNERITMRLLRKMAKFQWLSYGVPQSFGGSGLGQIAGVLIAQGLAHSRSDDFQKVFHSIATVGILPILFHGTPRQRRTYLFNLAKGKWFGIFAFAEPETAGDFCAIKTQITPGKAGENFLLNGAKQIFTNCANGHLYLVATRTIDGELSLAITRQNAKMIHCGNENAGKNAAKNSLTSISFENVPISAEDIIERPAINRSLQSSALIIGQLRTAAGALGTCQIYLNDALSAADKNQHLGRRLRKIKTVKMRLAEMHVAHYALESVVFRTAGMMDKTVEKIDLDAPDGFTRLANTIDKFSSECAIATVFGNETLSKISSQHSQVTRGFGLDYPGELSPWQEDLHAAQIFPGTTADLKQIIAKTIITKALLEEIPLRVAAKHLRDYAVASMPEFHGQFAAEKRSLVIARWMTIYLVNQGITTLRNELFARQPLLECFSDILMRLYALDSVVQRVDQQIKSNGSDAPEVGILKIIATEITGKIAQKVELGINALLEGPALQDALKWHGILYRRMALKHDVFTLKEDLATTLWDEL